jgi:lysophospholipase L1-like esterase
MQKVTIDGINTTLGELMGMLPGADPAGDFKQPLEADPATLEAIAAVVSRMQSGERVRMTFIGDSHIAGDWMTGHLRRVLQERHGDLGHGFIMPVSLYWGYRGQDINLCSTQGWLTHWENRLQGYPDAYLGFAGMSAFSADPQNFGYLETTHTNVRGRQVSAWELFTLQQPGGGTLLATVDDAAPVEITTAGGATGLQRTRIEVPDGKHRLTVAPKGDGEAVILGVSAEREGPGVLVDHLGINGKEVRSVLKWNPELTAAGMATLSPDLIVLAFGTNDANDPSYSTEQQLRDWRAVIDRVRAGAPDAPCVLIGASDRGKKLAGSTYAIWDRTSVVNDVQRQVAAEKGCAFWDWQQAMGGPGAMVAWSLQQPPLAAGDLIHLTQEGYELTAERFLAALEQTLE